MNNIKTFINGLRIAPVNSSGINAEGEMEIYSNSLRVYVQGAVRTVTTLNQSQTLTNKTIDADSNTISNIANANIKSGAAIAYSKLALTDSIVNADINSAAAIAYSKLALTGSIVNGDISASAAIAFSKLATLSSGNILVGSAGNVATSVAVSGEATISNAGAVTLTNSAVIGKVLTGYSAGAGTVAATDTILQAFNKVGYTAANAVIGPASSTDNALVRFDSTTGKLVQNSSATLSDIGELYLTGSVGAAATGLLNATISTSSGSPIGGYFDVTRTGNGTGEEFYGTATIVTNAASGVSTTGGAAVFVTNTGVSSLLSGFYAQIQNTGTGNIGNANAIRIDTPVNTASGPGIGNYAGLYIDGVAGGTVSGYNDAIHVTAGRTYLGGALTVVGTTTLATSLTGVVKASSGVLSAAALVNADVDASAAIAYSKLALTGTIVNADVSASAAIAYSKLALTGTIVNADVSASAAIAYSKLATLATGSILLGNAGVPTATALSGDITVGATGVTAIGANKVTNAMLAQVATATFKGRTSGSTGDVEDLTATQATALLNAMVGDSGSGGTKGLAPAPAAGDAAASKFLKADGTWSVPAGAGDVTGPASSVDSEIALFSGTGGKTIKRATGTGVAHLTSGVLSASSVVNADIANSTIDLTAKVTGTLPIANGGTNNGSLGVTAGGVYYGDGTKVVETGAGTAGQVLQSNGSSAPTWVQPAFPAKNYAQNAQFRFWQRQASETLTTRADAAYGADRWKVMSDGANVQTARISDGDTTFTTHFGMQLRQINASAARFGALQIIDGENCLALAGKTATFSFAARTDGTEVTTIRAGVIQWTGSLNSVTSDLVSSWGSTPTLVANAAFLNTPADITISSTYSRTDITVTFGTSMTNAILFIWTPNQEAQNDDIYIHEVELVEGSFYIPFDRIAKNWAEDELDVKRYYQKSYEPDTAPGTVTLVGSARFRAVSTNHIYDMRIAPGLRAGNTVTFYNPSSGATGSWRDESAGANRTVGASDMGTQNVSVSVTSSVGGNSMSGHWTYEGEL